MTPNSLMGSPSNKNIKDIVAKAHTNTFILYTLCSIALMRMRSSIQSSVLLLHTVGRKEQNIADRAQHSVVLHERYAHPVCVQLLYALVVSLIYNFVEVIL